MRSFRFGQQTSIAWLRPLAWRAWSVSAQRLGGATQIDGMHRELLNLAVSVEGERAALRRAAVARVPLVHRRPRVEPHPHRLVRINLKPIKLGAAEGFAGEKVLRRQGLALARAMELEAVSQQYVGGRPEVHAVRNDWALLNILAL